MTIRTHGGQVEAGDSVLHCWGSLLSGVERGPSVGLRRASGECLGEVGSITRGGWGGHREERAATEVLLCSLCFVVCLFVVCLFDLLFVCCYVSINQWITLTTRCGGTMVGGGVVEVIRWAHIRAGGVVTRCCLWCLWLLSFLLLCAALHFPQPHSLPHRGCKPPPHNQKGK